uniref:C-type lectin domain-containing protein n=1 Tax=Anopheles christyi TaxID=43041 RepID=A0A182KD88_9DIPT
MNVSKIYFGCVGIALLCLIITTNGYTSKTALEMIKQKLCVCPCGNHRGGKLYTVSNKRLNWFDAVAYCNSIGMSIVTIKDANERRLLQLYLEGETRSTRSQIRNQLPYWIGANNLAAGRGIRWGLTDQEVKGTAEWNGGLAPANDGAEQFCVYILGNSMKWVSTSCDDELRQFICEYQ